MNVLRFTVFIFLYPIITNVYAVKIETDQEKLSYSMGIFFGQTVIRQEMEIDIPAFMQAVEDVLNKTEKKLSDDEMQKIINTYQKKEQDERAAKSDNNKVDGKKFLTENKSKEGVIELPSGLQYKIIKDGEGEKPVANSRVVVHYRGTLIDGTEFDSSYARGEPIELGLNQVIKGWQEALQLMSVGSKWQIVIPSELAYGKRGAGSVIGPNSTLIFDIELINIKQ
jgi:FKBP-type peptidyl-prolyl cis-trans isomerase FklB